MTKFVKVLNTADLPACSMKQVKVNDNLLSIYNVSGTIYATSDICTHAECHLSDGFLDGKIVECPCHGGKFDVTTGEVKALPPSVPVKTYKTRIIGDTIEVAI